VARQVLYHLNHSFGTELREFLNSKLYNLLLGSLVKVITALAQIPLRGEGRKMANKTCFC
jgi:hypothetical protein